MGQPLRFGEALGYEIEGLEDNERKRRNGQTFFFLAHF
jgi:hypothetical protein